MIMFLLVHTNHVNHSGSLTEVIPSLVVHLLTIVATEEEEVRCKSVQGDGVEVLVSLANSNCLLNQKLTGDDVGAGYHIKIVRISRRHGHARLEHNKGAKRGHEAVGISILLHVEDLLFHCSSVQNGELCVEVVEEEGNAFLDHLAGQQTWRRSKAGVRRGAGDSIHAILYFGREAGLALSLPKFANNLGSRAFGTLLLGDRIVGA